MRAMTLTELLISTIIIGIIMIGEGILSTAQLIEILQEHEKAKG